MKNKIIVGTVLTTALLATTPVEAKGNASVEFISNDKIQVGETFTVKMNVTDIKDTYDGVVSMGGNLSFDSNKIEYVSSKGIETPYLFQINEDYDYKIAGLDFTLDNGIRETLTVYEFTFKALKEGNTTITLKNAKLTDSQDYIDTVVLEKEIEIIPEIEENIVVEEQQPLEIPAIITEKVNIDNYSYKEEIKETDTKLSKTIEETISQEVKEEQVEKIEKTEKEELKENEETETIIEKIQKVFSNIFLNLKKLFK